jgi:hypothetical protein
VIVVEIVSEPFEISLTLGDGWSEFEFEYAIEGRVKWVDYPCWPIGVPISSNANTTLITVMC